MCVILFKWLNIILHGKCFVNIHIYILIYSILLKIDFMKQQNVKCGFFKKLFISIFLYLLFDHFGINLHFQFL